MSNQYCSDKKALLASVGLAACKINHDLRNILTSAQLISDWLSQVRVTLIRLVWVHLRNTGGDFG